MPRMPSHNPSVIHTKSGHTSRNVDGKNVCMLYICVQCFLYLSPWQEERTWDHPIQTGTPGNRRHRQWLLTCTLDASSKQA